MASEALLTGPYYGRHDYCLYQVSWYQNQYWLARCSVPAPTPTEDVFGPAYPLDEAQLHRLLSFHCLIPAPEYLWPAQPVTTPTTSTTRPISATTAAWELFAPA